MEQGFTLRKFKSYILRKITKSPFYFLFIAGRTSRGCTNHRKLYCLSFNEEKRVLSEELQMWWRSRKRRRIQKQMKEKKEWLILMILLASASLQTEFSLDAVSRRKKVKSCRGVASNEWKINDRYIYGHQKRRPCHGADSRIDYCSRLRFVLSKVRVTWALKVACKEGLGKRRQLHFLSFKNDFVSQLLKVEIAEGSFQEKKLCDEPSHMKQNCLKIALLCRH